MRSASAARRSGKSSRTCASAAFRSSASTAAVTSWNSRRTARPRSICGAAARAAARLPAATEVIVRDRLDQRIPARRTAAAAGPAAGAVRRTADGGSRPPGAHLAGAFRCGLTFSIGWSFADTPADLSALSLAMGVCVARAAASPRGAARDVEMAERHRVRASQARRAAGAAARRGGRPGLCGDRARSQPAAAAKRRAAHWQDPVGHAGCGSRRGRVAGPQPRRNEVAACVASADARRARAFLRAPASRRSPQEWAAFDSLRDAPVDVLRHDGTVAGIARGADVDGALLMETAGGIVRVHAGEVSLRRRTDPQAEPAP